MMILALLIPVWVVGQTVDLPKNEDGKVHFKDVFEAVGTHDALFTGAKVFVAEAFKDAKAVLQMDDREAGILIGKGARRGSYKAIGTVVTVLNFTFKISVKDGRYRVEYYDWTFGDAVTQLPIEMIFAPGKNKKNMDGMAGLIRETVEELNGELAKQLSKKHDDW